MRSVRKHNLAPGGASGRSFLLPVLLGAALLLRILVPVGIDRFLPAQVGPPDIVGPDQGAMVATTPVVVRPAPARQSDAPRPASPVTTTEVLISSTTSRAPISMASDDQDGREVLQELVRNLWLVPSGEATVTGAILGSLPELLERMGEALRHAGGEAPTADDAVDEFAGPPLLSLCDASATDC